MKKIKLIAFSLNETADITAVLKDGDDANSFCHITIKRKRIVDDSFSLPNNLNPNESILFIICK